MAPEKLDDETKTEGINSGSIQPVRVTDERVLISSWMFLLLRAISYCCYSYRFSVMQSLLSVCMCVQGNYKSFGTHSDQIWWIDRLQASDMSNIEHS